MKFPHLNKANINSTNTRIRKTVFIIGILLTIMPLLIFKYSGFMYSNINLLFSLLSFKAITISSFTLPLGISFYTFSCLAYIIDTYQNKLENIDNIFIYATGISFFPVITAGPIEREQHLLSQFTAPKPFDYEVAQNGARQIIWGLFKKTVIADNLSFYVNNIYNNLPEYHGFALLTVSLFFTLEIYCDFSGYSDIAIGIAKLFNIAVSDNFKTPYFSYSIQEFWRNWHITLSTWFRDYIYIPCGGSHCSKIGKYRNTLLTFLLSGLWHGANWTFIIWGFLHGCGLIFEDFFNFKKIPNNRFILLFRIFVTFCFSNILWIFFRANTLQDSIYVLINMLSGLRHPVTYLLEGISELNINRYILIEFIFILIIFLIREYILFHFSSVKHKCSFSSKIQWCMYILLLFLIAQCSYKGSGVQFVYAHF